MGMCASAETASQTPANNAPNAKQQQTEDQKLQTGSDSSRLLTNADSPKTADHKSSDASQDVKAKTEESKTDEFPPIATTADANSETISQKQLVVKDSTTETSSQETLVSPETSKQNSTDPHNTEPSSVLSKSSFVEPVDLDKVAPLPVTQSPHALPRTEEDTHLVQNFTQTELKPFRNGVAKVLYHRRIWSRLASELDAAEEGDLLTKVDFAKVVEKINEDADVESPSQDNTESSRSSARPKAMYTPKMSTKERVGRRRVYEKHIRDYQINEVDTYPEMELASDEYLWLLTYSQHKARLSNPKHPIGKDATLMKNGRQFDIAQVPRLDDNTPLTAEWIDTMLSEFRKGKMLSHSDAFQICRRAVLTLLPEKNCVDLKIPKDATCTVVGDLHGQLDDLLMIFREAGNPSPSHRMLFNGDFVDRGAYSSEVVLTLLAYRALYPKYVYLNRGNHECSDMNAFDGFQKECELKYSMELYWFFNHVFAALPIAHLIQVGHQRVFVVHAGLSFEDFSIDEMNAENRFLTSFPMNTILQDLIWSDPFDGIGRQLSRRGAGCQFGIDVVQRFLIKNNVHLIIRSHECEDNGFALWFENRLYTIFSASAYCGDSANYGAFCVLSNAPSPQIRVYSAKQQVIKYSERQLQIRQALLAKVLVRIASRIVELEKIMNKIAEDRGTPGLIPPFAWSYALIEVLGLDAAFLPIATKLGVNVTFDGSYLSPDQLSNRHTSTTYTPPFSDDDRATRQLSFINTAGEVAHQNVLNERTGKTEKVLISIDAWVSKFKPKELDPSDLQGRISALLYDTTSPFASGLEQLFQHFDINGDGFITPDELTVGLTKILKYLGVGAELLTPENIDDLINKVDLNNDGEIDYNEFFRAFAYGSIDIEDRLVDE